MIWKALVVGVLQKNFVLKTWCTFINALFNFKCKLHTSIGFGTFIEIKLKYPHQPVRRMYKAKDYSMVCYWISIGNRMNLLVHFVIYGHSWCFESSQNCTSRRRVQFENFQNITSDHKSRNARASSYNFLLIIFSTKLLKHATLYALRTT